MDYNKFDEDLRVTYEWVKILRPKMVKISKNPWSHQVWVKKEDLYKALEKPQNFEEIITYFLVHSKIFCHYLNGGIYIVEACSQDEMENGGRQGRLRQKEKTHTYK